MMEEVELDRYSRPIIIVLTLVKKQMHFNELLKTLNNRFKNGKKNFISRPTLSNRLQYLEKNGLITRTKVKKPQYTLVNYSLNLDKTSKISEVYEKGKKIWKSYQDNKKKLFSLPEEKQIAEMLYVSFQRKLNEIKARIEYESKPNIENEYNIIFWSSPVLQLIEVAILEKSKEDEEYRKRVLKAIDNHLKLETDMGEHLEAKN
jgi:DNA-binding HxlR family transcriptional regulator